MGKNELRVEIWGDIVEIKSLIISIIISGITTMGAYFLAPANNRTKQLFLGLAGAVLGFIISTLLIKPKRIIKIEENHAKDKEKER